jgi:hypothetical protein
MPARLLLAVAILAGAVAAAGSAATAGTARTGGTHRLAGTWAGVLTGSVNGATQTEHIRIHIKLRETAGTWKVDSACYGKLTLDSISGGSHHYLRHLARGLSSSTCAGGDIDCLWPTSGGVYDNVTPRPDGWSRHGTLRRVHKK